MTEPANILDIDSIRRNGWRQGSVISIKHAELFKAQCSNLKQFGDDDLLIVVTQDCDLVHENLDGEPYVEILPAKPVPGGEKKEYLFWGRNPRVLQFELPVNHSDKLFQSSVHGRTLAPRELLAKGSPREDVSISGKLLRNLREWLAKRYLRQALPDSFNSRLEKARDKIQKALRSPTADHITGIYLTVVDDELPVHESYKIDITVTMEPGKFKDGDLRAKVHLIVGKLWSLMSGCQGIEVGEPELVSEEDVSLADLELLKRWDYDWMSFKVDPQGDLPRRV